MLRTLGLSGRIGTPAGTVFTLARLPLAPAQVLAQRLGTTGAPGGLLVGRRRLGVAGHGAMIADRCRKKMAL